MAKTTGLRCNEKAFVILTFIFPVTYVFSSTDSKVKRIATTSFFVVFLVLLGILAVVNYFDFGELDVAVNFLPCLLLFMEYTRRSWPEGSISIRKSSECYLIGGVVGFLFSSFYPNTDLFVLGMIGFLVSKFFLIKNLRSLNGFLTIEKLLAFAGLVLVSLICLMVFTRWLVDFTEPILLLPVFIFFVANIILFYSIWPISKHRDIGRIGVAGILLHLSFDIISIFSTLLENFDSRQILTLTTGFLSYYFISLYFYKAAVRTEEGLKRADEATCH